MIVSGAGVGAGVTGGGVGGAVGGGVGAGGVCAEANAPNAMMEKLFMSVSGCA